MLNDEIRTKTGAVESVVFDAIAAACRIDRASLGSATLLLDANLDSLTLISVLTRVEAVFQVSFAGGEAAVWVEARDLGELCSSIARQIAAIEAQRS